MNFQNIILANSINLTDEFEIMDEAAAAVESDLKLKDISSYKFSPALEACDEEMEYMCLENVKAYAVTEGFKETASKYWERFKAFIVKIKNLIVRTVQRVIGYLKALFTRVAAKIVAKFRGKDAKKMSAKVKAGNRYVGRVDVYPKLLEVDTVDKLFKGGITVNGKKIDIYEITLRSMLGLESIKNLDEEDRIRKVLEENFAEGLPSKSDIIEDILGDDTVEKEASGYADDIPNFVSSLQKAKIPKSVELFKKDIFKSIDKIEKEATKSKTISSKRMSALTSFMNKIVQFFNAALAAVQQLCVMWLQARIKVVNKFYNATEDKEENEDEE